MGFLPPRIALATACLASGLITAACAALGDRAAPYATKAALAAHVERAEPVRFFNDAAGPKH